MSKLNKITRVIKRYVSDPSYRVKLNCILGLYSKVPDEEYLKMKFRACTGYELNLSNPVTFNEKLQWLKLYNRRSEYTMMVDKYLVRDYVAEKIGPEYLIPLIGVWNSPEEIDFNQLPDRFVLKCNHNSGTGMCICKDRRIFNAEQTRKELRKGIDQNYYLIHREWPYKNVPRKIVCEEFISDGTHEDLLDYKVMCFNGVPRLIEVHKDRFSNHVQDFYDTEWKLQNISNCGEPMSSVAESKPLLLDKMLELSSVLAAGIPHVRVDWYIVNDKLYFGELTFFDGSGFDPFTDYNDDVMLGNWIELPQKTES